MARSRDGYLFDELGGREGLSTDAVVSSSSRLQNHYDIIVIGAGLCGLIAARNLALDRGLRVLLLEGRDRIGGRTWTAKAWGEEFEMGGTYVHWTQPHFYAELHRYGLEKHLKQSGGSTATECVFYKPHGKPTQRIDDVAQYNAECAQSADLLFSMDGMNARQLMPYPYEPSRPQPWQKYDHMSVQDRLDQLDLPQDQKDRFAAHTNSFGSAAAHEIAYVDALRWYCLGGYSLPTMYDAAASFKLGNGGQTNFARHILDEFEGDRVFGKRVLKIRQPGNSRVVVECADGSHYTSRYAVCTVPLNCLNDIHFDPSLGLSRKDAVSDGHKNLGEKYHFAVQDFPTAWFGNTSDNSNSDFLFGLMDHIGTQPTTKDRSFAMCFGHTGKLDDPTQSQKVIREFKKIQPEGQVRGYLSHTWSKDEFAKGAWFCAAPGQTTKNLSVLQEPHGRVIMASADWANGWRGFIDGAIEQGAKASATLKATIRAQGSAVTSRL